MAKDEEIKLGSKLRVKPKEGAMQPTIGEGSFVKDEGENPAGTEDAGPIRLESEREKESITLPFARYLRKHPDDTWYVAELLIAPGSSDFERITYRFKRKFLKR